MKIIGAFEAKTQLSRLLAEIEEKRSEYVIQRRGKNIALLIPYRDPKVGELRERTSGYLADVRSIRKGSGGKGKEIKGLIDRGRKR